MGRRRACLPIPAGLPHYPQISRGQTLGRSAIPDCPGGSTGTSRPFASLRAKGRSASGRVPPMDYLDNPERRSAARPSDDTSANSYGFAVASTIDKDQGNKLQVEACGGTYRTLLRNQPSGLAPLVAFVDSP